MRSTSGASRTTCGSRSSGSPRTTSSACRAVRAAIADARFDWLDDRAAERPEWIAAFLEMKTVWHPIGV